jgi:hypothetical protein
MTNQDYNRLWGSGFSSLSKDPIPTYNDYLIRERMLEDYIDIFRGFNTRDKKLEMPYSHPFFDKKGNLLLDTKPVIKYVLIGEAPPPVNLAILNKCHPIIGDENNTYFYNVTHVKKRQPWLSSVRVNWKCPPFRPCPINKINTLLCLASKGVLLLDLFPFAISYSKIRNSLNNSRVTDYYWNDMSNPYSIQVRLNKISSLLCKDWDLSMVAPCKISEYIVNPINAIPTLTISPRGLHPSTFRLILPDITRCVSSNFGNDWKKIAVAQQAPSARLLNLSF